jgi:microcystin degradation protein MlrC
MRCVIALMQHETNTFSTLPTPLSAFASGVGLSTLPRGEKALDLYGSADFAFAGLVDVAKSNNAEISIPIAAYAEPSGKVTDAAFDEMCKAICDDVAKGCDAVLLDLHGAMVCESYDDGEGELLRRIRAVSPKVPIAVALDFHTNLSDDMAENCTVIDGYRTYPHVDMYETGERVAQSLFHILDNDLNTQIVWRTVPMMTHMINQTPLKQPMKDIMNLAIEAVDSKQVLNASVFGGFPLADIPIVSLSVLVIEKTEGQHGTPLVNRLCDMAWERRSDFVFTPEKLSVSVEEAKAYMDFPVVIADHGDNSGAGGNCDDLTVLGEMLEQGMSDIVTGPIWDPEVVDKLFIAGEGAQLTIFVGGKTDVPAINFKGYGLSLSGQVQKLTDGRFVIEGPMQTGLAVNLGRTALFKTKDVELLITEERWEPYDTSCFLHVGIDPSERKYVLLKSRQHFRAGFESIAKHIVLAAGPGVCSSDYQQFTFSNLTRPIYPLDRDMELASTEHRESRSDA